MWKSNRTKTLPCRRKCERGSHLLGFEDVEPFLLLSLPAERYSATLVHGHKSWRGWIEWYAATAIVALWGLLSRRRRVFAYRIQKLREVERLPLTDARRAHEMLERPAARGKLVLVP